MNFITENEKYKIYSLDESIYLKEKNFSNNDDKFSNEDKFIGHHYGNPNDGIITENYVIVSACGISIYDLTNKTDKHLFTDESNRYWTNRIHQEGEDDYHTEFRFVSNNSDNKLRVFKMKIQTEKLTELEYKLLVTLDVREDSLWSSSPYHRTIKNLLNSIIKGI